MAKKMFRFLRGELNGYYLNALTSLQNKFTDTMQKALANYKLLKFDIDTDLNLGTDFNTFEILKGIGIVAGVFVPYVDQDSNLASLKFTKSHIIDNIQYSERGLFVRDLEDFTYVTEETTSDINQLATTSKQTSMVETSAKPKGYIPEGAPVLDTEGNIDYSEIVFFTDPDNYEAELPTDKAYVLFYGEKYLYLAESTPISAKVSNTVYMNLVKQLQWIRYNGCSIYSICRLADLMCHGFLYMFPDIAWYYGHGVIKYGIDYDVEADDKLIYASLFKLIVSVKFPFINFTEVNIKVTRDDAGNVTKIEETGE